MALPDSGLLVRIDLPLGAPTARLGGGAGGLQHPTDALKLLSVSAGLKLREEVGATFDFGAELVLVIERDDDNVAALVAYLVIVVVPHDEPVERVVVMIHHGQVTSMPICAGRTR
jgi:hypothetical protein